MTARGLLLGVALLASAPVDTAAACHRYSVWRYPWPQQCGVVALAHHVSRRQPARPVSIPDIPLPALAREDCLGGEADELTRARLMLRAALNDRH